MSALIYTLAFLGLLAVLILVHELGHYLAARSCGIHVIRFSLGFGRPLLRWQSSPNSTEWVISVLPLGGYVRMLDEREVRVPVGWEQKTFNRQSLARRSWVVAAGPLANFLLAWLLYGFLLWQVPAQMLPPNPEAYAPDNLPRLGKVLPEGVAARAGLKSGDDILSVNDEPVDRWDEFAAKVRQSGGQMMDLLIVRDGEMRHVQVVPETVEVKGQSVGRLGVMVAPKPGIETEVAELGIGEALARSAVMVGEQAALSLRSMVGMLTGETSLKQLSGPVVIADYAGQTARAGWVYYLKFMALLSISLGVLNLLPIPVLDGGHLMYHALELLRGGPLPAQWLLVGQRVGMVLVLLLMTIALFNDFSRLISG